MFPTLLMKEICKDTDCSLVCSWPKLNQEGQQKEFKKKTKLLLNPTMPHIRYNGKQHIPISLWSRYTIRWIEILCSI